MGYNAYVTCNCYKEGKTTIPPYKEFVYFDDGGPYLKIPNDLWKENEERAYKMDAEFDEWKRTACEHEDMNLADERLANVSGMAAFRYILKQLGGKDKFPVLSEFLPTMNEGILPSEFAQKLLDELKTLEKANVTEEKIVLLEKSTGDIKATVNSENYGFFIFTGYDKNRYGIDKDGFFIIENVTEKDKQTSKVMFRSWNFIQQTITKDCYRFVDIPTGNFFECSAKIHPGNVDATVDYEFGVKLKRETIYDAYAYIIEPLKKLAKASIQSGNPINWT